MLVGDISNTLLDAAPLLRRRGLGGVVFHELLGFDVDRPGALVDEAARPVGRGGRERVEVPPVDAAPALRRVVAHAPYSVSPALFREIARRESDAPLAVHLGESPEEIEFLGPGDGPIRADCSRTLASGTTRGRRPACDPVEYLARLGYLQPGMLAVHATHLDRRRARAACARPRRWS